MPPVVSTTLQEYACGSTTENGYDFETRSIGGSDTLGEGGFDPQESAINAASPVSAIRSRRFDKNIRRSEILTYGRNDERFTSFEEITTAVRCRFGGSFAARADAVGSGADHSLESWTSARRHRPDARHSRRGRHLREAARSR